ncbi:histidine acid phosphatase [Histomonas meleagridis]|uniref:histidine acid phosphatase n=1 Tax=Histomonas meleagridis TaxID=135588 RepID=UPI0035598F54|nr:histidine acid phosphatase [Histomonas meleagridis]KAH0805623.1 histidine acid phosphatase [Histomonas meleagridis]
MLFLFISEILSIDYVCDAPLAHADPIANGKLISVSLFLRHGKRTPMDKWFPEELRGSWVCDSDGTSLAPRIYLSSTNNKTRRYFNQLDYTLVQYPPNCQPGELVVDGMRQHHELGIYHQLYYGEQLRFIPKLIDPELLNLRSSYVERTFRSGESYMYGLYPPVQPGESITFTTGTATVDPISPSYDSCSDLMNDWNKFISTPEYIARRENARRIYKPIYDALNRTFADVDWMFIGDLLASYICNGQPLPTYITEEIIAQSKKDIAYYSYGLYNITRGNAGSGIWREYFRNTNSQLNGETKKKFWVYSGHDTTIMAMLSTLGIYKEELPPFRSHLAVELWEINNEKYVRLDYNGELVPIDFAGGNELVKYSEFEEKMKQYLVYCKEYE